MILWEEGTRAAVPGWTGRIDPEAAQPTGSHDPTHPRPRNRVTSALPDGAEPGTGPRGRPQVRRTPPARRAQALRVRPGTDRGRPRQPAADRRAHLRGRRELEARPDGGHRPQYPPVGG